MSTARSVSRCTRTRSAVCLAANRALVVSPAAIVYSVTANMYVSVLGKLGVQTDRIGDSTGQLEELSAL